MNISRKWLKEFVDVRASDREYDNHLTNDNLINNDNHLNNRVESAEPPLPCFM